MDVKPPNPSTSPSNNIPINPPTSQSIFLYGSQNPENEILRKLKEGFDERFPFESTADEKIRLSVLLHYLEQINKLQKINPTNIEEIKNNPIINEVLSTTDNCSYNIKSGGLFDDWLFEHIE
jgi:hypothetical protein